MIVEELKHTLCMALIRTLQERGQMLHTWTPCGGGTAHVADDGREMFIVVSPLTGDGIVITNDCPASGGSIHRYTRDAIAAGLL